MIRRTLSIALAAAGLAASLAAGPVNAQGTFPEKPVNLVVPFPPGGAGDIFGRLIAGEMQQRLGKPVIVQNKPGGGTMIAAREVASAPPDGHTILSGSSSVFVFPAAVRTDLPVDPVKDFEPIGTVASVALTLLTYADHPVKDVAGLIAAAKAAPGKLTLASYGTATLSHFAGEIFKNAAGIDMVHVPYKGSAPAMQDIMGKHVAFSVDTVTATKPRVEEGKVRALAVFSGKRSAFMPDVPTFAELGIKDVDIEAWLAFALPKGVPADVRAKLISVVEDTINNPGVAERLVKLGFDPGFKKMDDWQSRLTKEIAEMKAIAQKANIKPEE